MSGVRSFDVSGWDQRRAVAAKAGRTVSVCIPCRNEASTVGALVRQVCTTLMGP
jgi:hypothetical protein